MRRAVFPGSFDPVTVAHIDVCARASSLFDEVIVGVFTNVRKAGLFPVTQRVKLLEAAASHISNVRVVSFSGLLPDYMREVQADFIVRGLRSTKDFVYEAEQAQMIKKLSPGLETVFLLAKPEYACISSSGVREIMGFGGSIKGLVPNSVEYIIEKL